MLYSGALDNFVTPKHDGASYDIVINRTNTMSLEKIQKYTEEYFRDFAGQNNIKISVSGTGAMYILANNLIVHGEIEDIIISFIAVFIIMMLDFRSTGLTIVALWPIFVALLMDFGFMGIVGIPLNAATAIVASLAIGTGIDYSIHFIVKYRQEMAAMGDKKDVGEAIYRTIMHRGRSIMYNVLAVMAGFFVLLFSNFVPLVQFGGLVGFTMLTTGAGAVIMIPATLKYLEKGGKTLL
jgi:predicted RND superfamily exporter protein